MNEIQLTLRGNVATDPRHVKFDDGNGVTSFRLATTSRYFDRERNEWVSRDTTYLTVNCRRWLAENAHASLQKGQPVVVTGRLRERFWKTEDRQGRTLEIEALTVGHDLAYGESKYTRVVRTEARAADPQGDALALQVMQDGPADDRARRLVDVSGLPVVGVDVLEPDEDDDLSPENEFEELTLETVSA